MVPIGVIAVCLVLFVLYQNSTQTELVQSQMSSIQQEQDNKYYQKQEMRQHWKNYIDAKANNDYRAGDFGGISGLKVIFTNASDYLMNEMTASIKYIKVNGDEWRTIPVTVSNVPPHSTITHPVSDVHRGGSVRVRLTGTVSREAEFSMINGYDSGEPGNPYHMK